MILPLNKYNYRGSFKYKILHKHHRTWQNNTLRTLDFQKYYPLTQTTQNTKDLQKHHTLLDQFYMNFIPYSRYARTVLDCEKIPFLSELLDEPDTPLTFKWPPGL